MSNSSLVDITIKSPNHSGARTHKIDRITPHCVVGQLSAEAVGNCFVSSSRQASCNYGIGTEGKVVLCVDESNRSWCSSSNANDQRAVTIECASDKTSPYAFNDKVYNKLIDLCADICKRNGKKKLIWISDKTKALAYTPASDEMQLTVHRWFANKSCPGDWLFNRMSDLASKVTAKLGGATNNTSVSTPTTKEVTATGKAKSYDKNIVGTYKATSNLNLRDNAGVSSKSLVVIPKYTKVQCFGYYSTINGAKWYLVQCTVDGVKYTGFSHSNYLAKV